MAGACSSATTVSEASGGGGRGGEIVLFGVRVFVDSMRKSVSLNDLSQYEQPQEILKKLKTSDGCGDGEGKEDTAVAAGGYASADDAVVANNSSSGRNRERKRGTPWTEEEHKLFLLGLQKAGKGDWKGISRNFVKTRTPTQVASHAQKYFLRQSNLNRRRRRSSLFDITTETVSRTPIEEDKVHDVENTSQPQLPPPPAETNNVGRFPVMQVFPMHTVAVPVSTQNPMENLTLEPPNQANFTSQYLVHPVPIGLGAVPVSFQAVPVSFQPVSLQASTSSSLNLNSRPTADSPPPLSLELSLASDQKKSSSRHFVFQAMPSLSGGDSNSIISVA